MSRSDIGSCWGISLALTVLGDTTLANGDVASAKSSYDESLRLRHEIGDRWGEAVSLGRLADLRLAQGQPGETKNPQRWSGAKLRPAAFILRSSRHG